MHSSRRRRNTGARPLVALVVTLLALGVVAAAGAYLVTTARPTAGTGSAATAAAGLFSRPSDSGTPQTDGSPDGAADAVHPVAAPAQPNQCAGNTTAQYIRVSISVQHAWLCARNTLVYSTAVTTGMDHPGARTPTGTFHIQGRNTDTTLVPDTGEAYAVKFWIPFDAPAYGFHDASWQHFPYGTARYRTSGSHGCVHMPLRAMQFLYDWVHLGATVRIEQ